MAAKIPSDVETLVRDANPQGQAEYAFPRGRTLRITIFWCPF
jgi:hypothetical protein